MKANRAWRESIEIVAYFILMSAALIGVGVLIAICSLDAWPSAPAIRSYQSAASP